MRPYEVMIIFDASQEEEAIRASVDRHADVLRSMGGQTHRIERWGRRRFAYEVRHRWEGYYVLIAAAAEPAAMEELHRRLSLADEVIRHKVIRVPEAPAEVPPLEEAAG